MTAAVAGDVIGRQENLDHHAGDARPQGPVQARRAARDQPRHAVGVPVAVAVGVGLGVSVTVGVSVGVPVGVAVAVAVGVGVAVIGSTL